MFDLNFIEHVLMLKIVWLAASAAIFLAGVTAFYKLGKSRRNQPSAPDSETETGIE